MARVLFHYSGVYDQQIHKALKKDFDSSECRKNCADALHAVMGEWRLKEHVFVKRIESITSLHNDRGVNCFIVWHDLVNPMSWPMTIGVNSIVAKRSTKELTSIVLHELIHTYFISESPPWTGETWKMLWPDEPKLVRNHVPLYAIFALIPEAKEYLDIDTSNAYSKKAKDYIRAWEIVKDNPQAIIDRIKANA